jgi:two-component system, NarL family, nitrate/nitrite response regulator NarL
MPKRVRVLIADDHTLFAEALQAILATDERFDVVGQARNGEDALGLALSTKPDVVLMDISMPIMDGVESTEQILKKLPKTKVLMLTGSDSAADVSRAREAGAAGYVTKDRIAAELLEAIAETAGA